MSTTLYGKQTTSTAVRPTKYFKLEPGVIQVRGLSAYESAVANGYEGTEEEWLASLSWTAGSWTGTQAEYDALGTYDDNTIYFIIG
jgi:hypothetical protein